GQTTTESYNGMKPGRAIKFRTADIERLKRLPTVEWLAPRLQLGGWQNSFVVSYGTKVGSYAVFGDYPDFRHIVAFDYEAGRFIDEGDIAENCMVAVIGYKVREEMFPPEVNPIGEYIKISGVYFQVVGITHTLRSGQQGDRDAHTIYVPFTTLKTAFKQGDQVGFFAMTAKTGTDGPALEEQVPAELPHAHDAAPTAHLAIGPSHSVLEFGKRQE